MMETVQYRNTSLTTGNNMVSLIDHRNLEFHQHNTLPLCVTYSLAPSTYSTCWQKTALAKAKVHGRSRLQRTMRNLRHLHWMLTLLPRARLLCWYRGKHPKRILGTAILKAIISDSSLRIQMEARRTKRLLTQKSNNAKTI